MIESEYGPSINVSQASRPEGGSVDSSEQQGTTASAWGALWRKRQEQIQTLQESRGGRHISAGEATGAQTTVTRGQEALAQMSFLAPDDAEMLHLLKRFVSEASRLYENRTGHSLEDELHITSPADAYQFLRFEMEHLEQEQFRTINLDVRQKILSSQMIYQGTVGAAYIRIVEVFRPAIIDNASAVIVAHNHPAGSLEASGEDIRLTSMLVDAGKLLDLEVLDHLIISRKGFLSLKEKGLGFD